MSANDEGDPAARRAALPLVRMTLACRDRDEFLREFLPQYRVQGVFVPGRVRPVGERIRFKIELLDCSAGFSGEAVVASHVRRGSESGMRVRLEAPEAAGRALDSPLGAVPSHEPPPDPDGNPPLAVCLADYLFDPPPAAEGAARASIRAVGALEPKPRAGWPPSVRDLLDQPSIDAVECLHRLCVRTRVVEPRTAVAAAEAMVDLAKSDRRGELVRIVRLLTRNGHEILEFALERLESAQTPGERREAQRLFDDTLQTIVVP